MTFTHSQPARKASRGLPAILALTVALGAGISVVGVTAAHTVRRDAKDDTAYTFKRVYKSGEVDRYRLTTKMNIDSPQTGGPTDIVTTMLMKELTKEAKEDGASTSVAEFETAQITLNGMDIDITTMMPKVITTRDKSGKSEIKMEGGNEQVTSQMGDQMKQFTNFGSGYMPSKPVKVGDSWDVDASSLATKGQTITGKVTFVSVETVKGVKVAKMKTVMDMSDGKDSKMHSTSTSLVDVATGKPINMVSKVEGDTGGGKLSIEVTMKMLSKDDVGEAVKAPVDAKKP